MPIGEPTVVPNKVLSKYDMIKPHHMEDFELLVKEPNNISFIFEGDLYEFCTFENKHHITKPYKLNREVEPYYEVYDERHIFNLPYVFDFVNKQFNEMIGMPSTNKTTANYMVFGIVDTDDEEEIDIAREYIGQLYISMFRRLVRSYERLPVAIRSIPSRKESLWEKAKRFLGIGKTKPPVVYHEYILDIDRMNLHQMVRNASMSIKKEMDPKHLSRLNKIHMLVIISTATSMSKYIELQGIGRCYVEPLTKEEAEAIDKEMAEAEADS